MKNPTLEQLLQGGPGLDGYAYNADVYCESCGDDLIRELFAAGKYSEDSNYFPQPIFNGQSDCAQTCSICDEYLYGTKTCFYCGLEITTENQHDDCGHD